MAAGMMTNTGRTWTLQMRIGRRQPEDLLLKLYVNEHTPGRDDVAHDYEEPIGQGYHPVRLKSTEWDVQPATGDQAALATYPKVAFVFDGPLPQPLQGYFLVGGDSGDLVGVQPFDAARPIEHTGDEQQIVVTLLQR